MLIATKEPSSTDAAGSIEKSVMVPGEDSSMLGEGLWRLSLKSDQLWMPEQIFLSSFRFRISSRVATPSVA
ncbi:MAG: hypothetical protein HC897_20205 [Thermoanaerobaculia bacterium]|nr:hypothetical protein [Thermoanaerobaculia bacterium]